MKDQNEKREIKIKTKRLMISNMTDEEMAAYISSLSDVNLKPRLEENFGKLKALPIDRLWYGIMKVCPKDDACKQLGVMFFSGPEQKGKVRINFYISKEYENCGYATEAVKAVTEWAFSQADVYTVEAETEQDNVPAQKVLAKAEYKAVGRGDTGPLFSKRKPDMLWIAVYMCIGISIGMSFGAALGNIAVGVSVGLSVGLLIGALMDKSTRAHRAAVEGRTENQIKKEGKDK